MNTFVKRSLETYLEADWVSHVRLMSEEIRELNPEGVHGMNNIRYTVHHIEVFKKPPWMFALSTEIFGSSLGHLMLEEGKEYLLCGEFSEGILCCTPYGQVKPDEISHLVAEWNQIPYSFIE
ncbi:hypothetical protein PMAYCL1PPCAC_13110, partial [Pristionchus mayeri]